MKEVIVENTAEDELTPESGEVNALSKARNAAGKESFKTHDFASIDSFVQLEN